MPIASIFAAASVAALTALSAHAGDGRAGPIPFTGRALDAALKELNGFVQTRYAVDDAMAALSGDVDAVAPLPVYVNSAAAGFGPLIGDGRTFEASLVSLARDMGRPSLPMLIRARMMAPSVLRGGFGPRVSGDASFEASLTALHDAMTGKLPVFAMIAALGRVGGDAGDFGPHVSNGAGLDRYLVAFNARNDTPLPVFATIAEVNAANRQGGPFGPAITGDDSLDASLAALAGTIAGQTQDAAYVTGAAFDAYAATLTLY